MKYPSLYPMSQEERDREARFEELVQARANRLGISVEECLAALPSEPRFIRAAEERGKRLGISGAEVLKRDLERIERER